MSRAAAPRPPAAIPVAALDDRAAIVGRTGSGKTYAARGAVEGLLGAGRQVVVVDPTGAWWGLRYGADGRADGGYAVAVLGGDRGDAALPPDAGGALARFLLERRLSAVLDTSDMEQEKAWRFCEGFLAELNRSRPPAPLHLVLDEADELAPQAPQRGQQPVRHQASRMVRQGRSKGYRTLTITQRPAILDKTVLSQAGFLAALQLTSAQDRKAIGAWIEGQADRAEAKELLATLPRLAVGEGWAWWPAHGPPRRVRFPRIATFDSGRAPDGAGAPDLPAPAAIDLDALREILGPAEPEDASPAGAAAGDAALRREAAGLRAENGRLRAEAADLREAQRVYRVAMRDAAARLMRLSDAAAGGGNAADVPAARAAGPVIDGEAAPAAAPAASVPAPRPRSENGSRAPARAPGDGGAEARVLRVLASMGRPLTARQWATLAGLSARGGTWSAYLARLRSRGLVEQEGGLFRPSPAAAAELGDAGPPPDAAAVQRRWVEAVGAGGAGRMLRTLIAFHPGAMTRASLAGALGLAPSGGTFSAYLGRLTGNGLVEKAPRGAYRASPDLFPGAGGGRA